MGESYKCYGTIGTTRYYCSTFNDDYELPAGTVWMTQDIPFAPGPDRFGGWEVMENGTYQWVKYPDPPFNVVFHEGKLKNLDTMEEISIEALPGDIAARIYALENPQA